MRLAIDARLPVQADAEVERLRRQLADQLGQHASQVNLLTEGRISAVHSAMGAPPSTGIWAQGDFIRNAMPSETGSTGNKYVIAGWLCVTSGTPGAWVACRFLTGN
jgi:hypothetical protein